MLIRVGTLLSSSVATGEGGAPLGEVWVDPSDLSSMRQERTGASATTAAAVGSPVGSIRNRGSLGGWLVTASDGARPVLRSSGGLYWLEFDGTDDYLRLTAPALDLVTIGIYAGVEILGNDTLSRGIVTLSPATGADYQENTGFPFYINNNDHAVAVQGGNPTTMVLSGGGINYRPHVYEIVKPDNDSATLRMDNAVLLTDSTITSDFTTHSGDLFIGCRASNNNPINYGEFALYGLVISNDGAVNSATLRAYLEGKTNSAGPVYPDIADLTELSAARDALIAEVFSTKGAVLPTEIATLEVESPDILNGILTPTNLLKSEKLVMTGYTARPRLWTPIAPRDDIIVLLHAGHSVGIDANGLAGLAMQPLLTRNIRVCTFVMPGGANDYTSGSDADHDEDMDPLSEFVGPVVIAINTLLDEFPGATIYMSGISGGGWTTTLAAAVDARIAKSFPFVGTLPDYVYTNRDWEQRLPGVTAEYLELYLLGACPNRVQKHVLYEEDPVGFNRAATDTRADWSTTLTAQATSVGGGYELVWVDYDQHAYESVSYAAIVLSELPTFPVPTANALTWGTDDTHGITWGSDEITWGA